MLQAGIDSLQHSNNKLDQRTNPQHTQLQNAMAKQNGDRDESPVVEREVMSFQMKQMHTKWQSRRIKQYQFNLIFN